MSRPIDPAKTPVVCSFNFPRGRKFKTKMDAKFVRCLACDRDGVQCELLANHDGPHQRVVKNGSDNPTLQWNKDHGGYFHGSPAGYREWYVEPAKKGGNQ